MWPSIFVDNMHEGPLHKRSLAVSLHIIGEDSTFDFDMLIYKNTNTAVPWH